jgi:hypothetical protein
MFKTRLAFRLSWWIWNPAISIPEKGQGSFKPQGVSHSVANSDIRYQRVARPSQSDCRGISRVCQMWPRSRERPKPGRLHDGIKPWFLFEDSRQSHTELFFAECQRNILYFSNACELQTFAVLSAFRYNKRSDYYQRPHHNYNHYRHRSNSAYKHWIR